MKKRIVSLVLALVSLCALLLVSVPGTMAILIDRSQPIVNTFAPASDMIIESVDTAVNVQKTVHNTGEGAIGPGGFRFVLKNIETGEERLAESDAGGFASFPLSFSEFQAGETFAYELYELNTRRPGVTYSDSVYTVEIAVTHEDALAAEVRINGVPADVAAFRNIYDSSSVPTPPETGDAMNPVLYAVLVLCALSGLALLRCDRKKGGVR